MRRLSLLTTAVTLLAAAATLLAAAGCSAPDRPEAPQDGGGTWEQRLAAASYTRARDLARRGRREAASETARLALRQAVHAGDRVTEARALVLLSRLDDSREGLLLALDVAGAIDEGPVALEVQLDAVQGLLELGAHDLAVPLAPALLEAAAAQPDPSPGLDAQIHHLRALLHLQEGRAEAALAAERRAVLLLSLLPDSERLPLRRATAQTLGDLFARRDPAEAFEWHARAADLAARADEPRPRAEAFTAMARDLTALGRHRDAHGYAQRALLLARDLQDRELLEQAGRCGLGALHGLREPDDSPRFEPFRQALADAADPPARPAPPAPSLSAPAPRGASGR